MCKTGKVARKQHQKCVDREHRSRNAEANKPILHSLEELVNDIWACGRTIKSHNRGCQDMQSERGQKMLSRFFIILHQLYCLVCLVYYFHIYSKKSRPERENGMEWNGTTCSPSHVYKCKQAQVHADCALGIRPPCPRKITGADVRRDIKWTTHGGPPTGIAHIARLLHIHTIILHLALQRYCKEKGARVCRVTNNCPRRLLYAKPGAQRHERPSANTKQGRNVAALAILCSWNRTYVLH